MNSFTKFGIWAGLLGVFTPSVAFARGNDSEQIGIIFGAIVVGIIVFLICRELVCWYNKTNEHGALLREIRDELRAIRGSDGDLAKKTSSEKNKDSNSDAWS